MLNQISITPYLEPNVLSYYSFDEIINLIPDCCVFADGFVKYPDGNIFTDNLGICGLYDHIDEISQLINVISPLEHPPIIDLTAYSELPSRFAGAFSHLLSQRIEPEATCYLKIITAQNISLLASLTHSTSIFHISDAEISNFGCEFGCSDAEMNEISECVIHTLNPNPRIHNANLGLTAA